MIGVKFIEDFGYFIRQLLWRNGREKLLDQSAGGIIEATLLEQLFDAELRTRSLFFHFCALSVTTLASVEDCRIALATISHLLETKRVECVECTVHPEQMPAGLPWPWPWDLSPLLQSLWLGRGPGRHKGN